MKKAIYLYVTLCLLTILTGCGGGQMPRELQAVSEIINDHPDSALVLLDSMEVKKATWNKDVRMRYDLLRLKAQNKAGVLFSSDSLAKTLTGYFDSHGSRNDRLLTRYLLGRAYQNMGDAPMALQTYFDAIEQADTTATDCDYNTLMGVYGQMAMIFHQQNLPHDEIRAINHYADCISRFGSEIEVIEARSQRIRPYYLLGEKDSVLQIINDTYKSLLKLGNRHDAADWVGPSIYLYLERGELEQARQMKDIFENESNLFDEQGNIAIGREFHYVIRGFYDLACYHTDSAEYHFRKALRYGHASDCYKGLMTVYQERHNADSVIHYALLFETAQDSLHNQMRTDAVHQMSALYDYTRSQQQAEREAQKARTARTWAVAIIVLATLIVAIIVYYYRRGQARRRREILRLDKALSDAKAEREGILHELTRLKAQDYEGLIAEKERREQELEQMIASLQSGNNRQPTDNLEAFADSKIAELFKRKSEDKTERPVPTEAEWRLLESQFCKDMPATYEQFCAGRKLSPLELRTCILLILGYPENIIVKMTEKSPQAVTTAKTRANEKLFGQKEAHSLKSNLLRLQNRV
ncbi:MAG: hypothetical protein IJ588_01805 [Prevotella sp.]|nr:hypothetical protein [Prevotella sp.]